MRAAELGIALQRVEVVVDSESDDRGILAMDDEVPAGPLRAVAVAAAVTYLRTARAVPAPIPGVRRERRPSAGD